MKFVCLALVITVACVAEGRQLLNEDQMLDEMNYASHSRSKRALCGGSAPVTRRPWIIPTRDPLCYNCNCFVTSKRAVVNGISSGISSSIISPFRCDYTRCCLNRSPFQPVINGKASSASVSDSSVKAMASSLIKTFGKRASDNDFKKPSVDLVFLLDDSGSIPAAQFEIAKEGAATLSLALCPQKFGSSRGEKQVSVVLFSTTARTVMSFTDSQKGAGYVEETIMDIKQRSGATATTDAIKHVREKVLGRSSSRLNDPDTATIVFVVTDGKCNNGCGSLAQEAKRLRETGPGVQVFAFGVGEADCDELELIRGKEAGKVFGLPDFNFFEKLAVAVKEQMAEKGNSCM